MNNTRFRILSLIILFSLIALACGLSAQPTSEPQVEKPITVVAPTSQPISIPAPLADEEAVLIQLYNQINPAVVQITTYVTDGRLVAPSGQGSGFVYDSQGHIISNAHVVHGADQVEVTYSDGSIDEAEVLGEDLHSDLAVLKVDNLPAGVSPIALGNIDNVAVGQTVVALGNPFGLGGTLTKGVVSALGRTIPALTTFSIPQAIQTDAPINPGNSGGPLLNLKGEVIGVNAQIETGGTSRSNSGIGFAIPVSIVRLVVPSLIEEGVHHWAWLGVVGGTVNPILVKAMDLPVKNGAYISEVVSGAGAARAGLRGATSQENVDGRLIEVGGDVIIAIDGNPVTTFEDILLYITLFGEPGKDVSLTIVRDGETIEVVVTLQERPEDMDSSFPFP